MSDDEDLVSGAKNGSMEDFQQLVRRHQRLVFAILSRYERDQHWVEDLAQETFVKAWCGLAGFDGRKPFENWIGRIATNAALDHLRRRKRRQSEIGIEDLGDATLDWLQSEESDRAPRVQEAREILDVAMSGLSPEDRLVITLQEIEGRSLKEISALTGWSAVSTRVRAHRAKTRLRKALEKMKEQSNG